MLSVKVRDELERNPKPNSVKLIYRLGLSWFVFKQGVFLAERPRMPAYRTSGRAKPNNTREVASRRDATNVPAENKPR